ncbi:VWA domain-containing protein [Desulfosarcina cetonica]|uniref:VWA domain-containing protein n=1 Tax=Desulfosarcina cetonica TaxID=90730 RepID=UPI0006CFADE4|nr:VWA domain-containing protein [Desulfosarcina cetonica]
MEKKNRNSRKLRRPASHAKESDEGHLIRSESVSEEEQVVAVGSRIDAKRIKYVEKDKMERKKVSGRRIRTLSAIRGTYVRSRKPVDKIRDVALDATIRSACIHCEPKTNPTCRLTIRKQDVREKIRIGKVSTPTVFVVDASGSMFTYERMESAKGAIFSMLIDSYQKRDKVGLVAFREHKAEVILPICNSLDWGIKCLKALGTGGPTPLSAGLQKGIELLLIEKRRNRESLPVLVLLSDGRANVPLTAEGTIEKELVNLTNQAWINKLHMIFIDVEKTVQTNKNNRFTRRFS